MSRRNPADVDDTLTITFDARFEDPHTAEVTLLEVIRGTQAWQRVQQANLYNEPAPEGQEYLLARIRFKLTDAPSPDMQYALWSGAFTAVSQDGRDYPFSLALPPGPPIDASLYPGASHEGWEVFQVSADDEQPLLAFGRAFDGTGGAWWKMYDKTASGEQREDVEWFNCSAWGKLAEVCNQYLTKGSQVYVEGRLKSRSYETQNIY
jgi:hypothetical protein